MTMAVKDNSDIKINISEVSVSKREVICELS